MPKSFSIISEKQKLVPKNRNSNSLFFFSKLLQRIFNVLFHKGEKTKPLKLKTLKLLSCKAWKKLEMVSVFWAVSD